MVLNKKPADHKKKVTYRDLIEDAAWLTEELESLKCILPELPYSDRPMGQESILDILAKIGAAHEQFFTPLINNLQTGGEGESSVENIDFETLQANQATFGDDPLKLLDKLISQRLSLVATLEKLDESAIHGMISLKTGDTDVFTLINRMILFDRSQLKKVAERMLAMDAERHVPGER